MEKNKNRTDIEAVIDVNVYIYYTCMFCLLFTFISSIQASFNSFNLGVVPAVLYFDH